ncbi:MucD [Dissulfurispira thermophila]|uniref:MucD n=2 Tax=root TaxID=1 RepID=A0A7G1H338_9BACT|nr:DegQ family serine endoprotease [Dissulfurispira thermophila]BCB97235.1 MucD [Dissulfurispira thermophila]
MMKKSFIWVIIILLIGFLLGGITYYLLSKAVVQPYTPFTPRVPKQIEETSRAFSDIVKAVSPSVVNISSMKVVKRQPSPFDDFFDFLYPFPDGRGRKWKEQSLGSGVIVSSDGYIVTNNHVVEQADEIKVLLIDKKSFKAKIVGSDPKTDIAIIKIDAKGLPMIPWGDSDKLQVGEFVLAIGNPFGLSHTVTMGIISAVGRADIGITDYENFIQTDAAINPGNSGGPLVNIKGELIGINTAIFSKTGGYQGIGFAVPSNMVRIVMDQLIKQGKVTRGWLGITIQEITPEIAQKFGLKQSEGALVSDVARNSPAHKAGIIRGDIILEFNGKKIRDVATLRNMVAQSRIGSQVEMKILRRDKEIIIRAIIMELPADLSDVVPSSLQSTDMNESALSGVTVMDLNAAIAKQLGIDRDEKGVVIVKIEHGSSAEDVGLRKGDVIQEMDRQRINNMSDFNKMTSKIKTGDSVLLFINRSGKKFYVALPPQ